MSVLEKAKKKRKLHEDGRRQNYEIESRYQVSTNDNNQIEYKNFKWDNSYGATAESNAKERTESGVDFGTRYNDYYTDLLDLQEDIQEYANSGYSIDGDRIRRRVSDLRQEAKEMLRVLQSDRDTYASNYGEETYQGLIESLSKNIDNLLQTGDAVIAKRDVVDSFSKNEEPEKAYGKYEQKQKYVNKYGTELTYEQVQEAIANVKGDKASMLHDLNWRDEIEWLEDYGLNYGYKNEDFYNSYLKEIEDKQSELAPSGVTGVEYTSVADAETLGLTIFLDDDEVAKSTQVPGTHCYVTEDGHYFYKSGEERSEFIDSDLESLTQNDEDYNKLREKKAMLQAQRELHNRSTVYDKNFKYLESKSDYDERADKGAKNGGFVKSTDFEETEDSDNFAWLRFEDVEATHGDELEQVRRSEAFTSTGVYGLDIYFHDNERRTYNYFLGISKEKAEEYYNSMKRTLTARRNEYANDVHYNFSENANFGQKLVAGTLSTLSKPFGVVTSGVSNVAGMFNEDGVDPYDDAHGIINTSNKIRNYEAQHIENSIDNKILGKVASVAYQSANSIVDMGITAGIGAITGGGSLVTGVAFGLDSANSYIQSAYDRGVSKGQLYTGAILTGIAEGFFEKYSLDKIIKMKPGNVAKIITNALVSAGIEGSEEVATEIAQTFIDNAFANYNSENALEIKRLVDEEGLTEEEARRKVFVDNCSNVIWAGVGGAFAGLGFGGIHGAMQLASNSATVDSEGARAFGENVLSDDKQQKVLDKAKELGIDTSKAERALKKLNKTAENIDENSTDDADTTEYYKAFDNATKTIAELELYIEQSGESVDFGEETEFTDDDLQADIENKRRGKEIDNAILEDESQEMIVNDPKARGTNNAEIATKNAVANEQRKAIAEEVKKLTSMPNKQGKMVSKAPDAVGVLPSEYTKEEKAIENFFKKQGLNTVIYDSNGVVINKKRQIVDGFKQGDTIYLNRKTALKYVFKHEFVHTQEAKQGYEEFGGHIEKAIINSKRLSAWIDNKAKSIDGYNKNATLEDKIALVKNHYNPQRNGTLSNTEQDFEFYADFVMDNLYNGTDIESTVAEMERAFADKNVWQKFCDFIRRLLKNMKNLGIYDGAKITKLENEFSKVVRTEKTVENDNKVVYNKPTNIKGANDERYKGTSSVADDKNNQYARQVQDAEQRDSGIVQRNKVERDTGISDAETRQEGNSATSEKGNSIRSTNTKRGDSGRGRSNSQQTRTRTDTKNSKRSVSDKIQESSQKYARKIAREQSIRDDSAKSKIESLVRDILVIDNKGENSYEKIVELADVVAKNTSYISERNDYYDVLLEQVKGYGIKISDSVKSEFGEDWNEFRLKNSLRMGFRKNGHGSVEEAYDDLSENSVLSGTAQGPAEQLKEIADVLDSLKGGETVYLSNEEQIDFKEWIIPKIQSEIAPNSFEIELQEDEISDDDFFFFDDDGDLPFSISDTQAEVDTPAFSISENFNDEEHNEVYADAVKKHFGVTYNWNETGYILADGSRLDFSGKNMGARGGSRTIDHREINQFAFEEDNEFNLFLQDLEGSDKIVDFLNRGNIRIMPETAGIEVSVKPTEQQITQLKNFVSRNNGEVTLDISDETGNIVASLQYPKHIKSDVVINDIIDYFDKGRVPQEFGGVSFSISEQQDTDYLKAVENGDMETAQKMVDEVAREKGYTVKAYHGTPNGDFTVFKNWQYFTESKEYADVYQNQGASSNGYKLTANNPKTYSVYLKQDKIFDTRNEKEKRIFENEFYRQWGNGAPLSEKGLPDWTDGDDFVEFFEENDYDYDAILLDEGATGGFGDEVKSRGVSIVVKNSNQIKSAEPVVYDDDGNVIPLSKRFDESQDDIRFSISDEKFDFESFSNINKENLNNIKSRNGIVVESEAELEIVIEKSLSEKKLKENYYLSSLPDDVISKIKSDINKDIFKNGQYTFSLSSDDIKHISKHFKTVKEIKQAIYRLYDVVCNYDTVEWFEENGENRLRFKKSYSDYDFLSIEIASKKRRAFDLVTFYLTKNNKKSRGQNTSPANTQNNGELASKGVSSSANISITNSDENVNPKLSVSDDFDNLVDEYGSIPEGMNAERDIAVPKRTSKNQFTSYVARSIMEKGSVDDATLEQIKEQVVNEALSHKRWSDKEALDYAQQQLEDGEAEIIWNDVVSGKTLLDKNKIAVAEGLLEMYANEGKADKVLTLTAELCEAGTRAGQVVQAFSLLKNMGGVGRLYYLQKVTDSINRDIEKKFGKNKKRVKIEESLATRMMNAKSDGEVQKASEDIMKSLGEQVPPTFLDKWNAWRYLSMLGNPRTHIRNLVGNAIFMPAISIKNGLATAMEHAFIRDVNNRTKAVKVSKEVKEFAEKDFEEMKEFVSSGGKYQDGSQIQEYQRVFKSKVLEGLRKFNFDMLEKEDIIFLKHHYKMAFARFITARKLDVNNLTEKQLWEAREYATLEAQKATYRDASAVAEAINRMSHNNLISNVLIEGILPFKKTPINILKRGVEYSPIGLIKTLTKGSVDLRKGKITASQYIDGISSGLSGTGIMALGVLLGALGVAVGGMGDDEDKWFRQQNGEQEYSITFFGKSYTVDWAAPSCIPFFIGVELQKILSGENENWVTAFVNALDGALEPLTNLSMLQGINDTLDTIKWSDSPLTSIVTDSITSYFTQALPTLAGQITRVADGTRRKNYVDKNSAVPEWLQKIANTVSSKTGNWGKNPYRNAWGETEVDESIVGRIVSNFISPGYYSSVDYDAVNTEIARLYNAKGNKLVLPETVDNKISVDGVYKYLNADEYEKFQMEAGQNAYKYIEEVMNSSFYKKADDDTKVDMLDDVYSYCENLAKTTVSDYALSSTDLKTKLYLERGVSMADYLEAKYSEQSEETEIETDVEAVNELLDSIEANYSGATDKMSMVDMAVKFVRDKQRDDLNKTDEFIDTASNNGYDIGGMFVANEGYGTDKKQDKLDAIRNSEADSDEKYISMAFVYLDKRKVAYNGVYDYFNKLKPSDKLKYITANESSIMSGINSDYPEQ